MIKLKRRILTILLVFIVFTSLTNVVYADKLSDRLKKQKSQLAKNRASYQEIVEKIDNIEANIEKLDEQIENMLDKVNSTNSKISSTKHDINLAEKAINSTSKSIESEQSIYSERLRAMYMNGPTGYLELILNSTSFIDFLERYELTKSIMRFDTNLINSLENKKKVKQTQKAALLKKKSKLIALQNEYKANLSKLNSAKSKQKILIKYLKAQEKKYRVAIKQYNDMINTTLKQIAAMKKKLKNPNSTKYSSDAVVVYSANFLGVRYVWGGTTPNGFDCSGFTKYVYAHFGIKLNRVSRDQAKQGTRVSRANLKPGDLVFFGSPIHHVGIYVGNNSFIHSPRTGDVVKISPMTRKDFVFGTRIR